MGQCVHVPGLFILFSILGDECLERGCSVKPSHGPQPSGPRTPLKTLIKSVGSVELGRSLCCWWSTLYCLRGNSLLFALTSTVESEEDAEDEASDHADSEPARDDDEDFNGRRSFDYQVVPDRFLSPLYHVGRGNIPYIHDSVDNFISTYPLKTVYFQHILTKQFIVGRMQNGETDAFHMAATTASASAPSMPIVGGGGFHAYWGTLLGSVVLLLSTLVFYQPTELIWAFFLFHKFSNLTPPPSHPPGSTIDPSID